MKAEKVETPSSTLRRGTKAAVIISTVNKTSYKNITYDIRYLKGSLHIFYEFHI